VPNMAADLRGERVFDPRVNSEVWSDNWANHVAHYLQSRPGFRLNSQTIDRASWIEAANVSDEAVPLKAGGFERRYTVNGSYSLDEDPDVVLQRLVDAGAGTVVEAGGTWFIHAGAWRPPTRTIGPDDLRGDVVARLNRPARDLANGVRATFVRPEANWQPTDAPVLLDNAALVEDGGAEVYADLELPYTASAATAQRLMKLWLQRNRAGLEITLPCTLAAFGLRPGSVIEVDLDWLPERVFRVVGWTLDEDMAGVTLVAAAERASFYAWSAEADERELPPAPGVVRPSSVTSTTPQITVTPPTAPAPATVAASWTVVSGALDYRLDWILPGADTWNETTHASTSATISTGGRASFRVRARTAGGVSDWDLAPFPAALRKVSATGIANGVRVSWNADTTAASVQVFTGPTNVFASATKAATDPTSYPFDVTGMTPGDTVFVWARPVSDKGVVGAELGPIELIVGSDVSNESPDPGVGSGSDGTRDYTGSGSGGEG
jgi:hypothetical protein